MNDGGLHRDAALAVVGQGAAGLAAALAAAERAREIDRPVQITLVDRAPAGWAGGGTRFSPSNMRLADAQTMAREFEAMIAADPRHDRAYFETLANQAQPAIAWLEGHGVAFEQIPYYLAATPRYRPVGGGAALISALTAAATAAGVNILCDFDARAVSRDAGGAITALCGGSAAGERLEIAADAVVLACGGFAGNGATLQRHLGAGAERLRPISPGTAFNTGAGIAIAQALGASVSGDWTGMHSEPIDPARRIPPPSFSSILTGFSSTRQAGASSMKAPGWSTRPGRASRAASISKRPAASPTRFSTQVSKRLPITGARSDRRRRPSACGASRRSHAFWIFRQMP